MLTMTRQDTTDHEPEARVRVAPREVLDTAYRAMRVAGATAGEAQLAARSVLRAELDETGGLALLLDELPRVTGERVPGHLRMTPDVAIIEDPARRGLFFSVPAAVEICLATDPSRPVCVPSAAWRPAVGSLLDVCAGSGSIDVHAAQFDRHGRPIAGELEIATEIAAGIAAGIAAALPPEFAGLIIWGLPNTDPEIAISAQRDRERRAAEAARDGITVDRRLWSAAGAAARDYLVPERQ